MSREACGLEPRRGRAARRTTWRPGSGELGILPTGDDIVFERFFDEAGGMQMVVHAPLGGRINRGLGLALRKRFCATFDFELQAAANDDAVVLSLGPAAQLPARQRAAAAAVRDGRGRRCAQAVLASPMFAARWRWNLNRSLAVLRFRGGKKNPLPIQRMESDDLMAAVFPALAACQENAAGRSGADPRPRPRAPDAPRLPARGHGRRRARRPAGRHGVGRRCGSTSSSRPSRRCSPTRS